MLRFRVNRLWLVNEPSFYSLSLQARLALHSPRGWQVRGLNLQRTQPREPRLQSRRRFLFRWKNEC